MEERRPANRGWVQASPRAEMVLEVRALDLAGRAQRLRVRRDQAGYVDDEAVVTLFLDACHEGSDARTYTSELLGRLTRHVGAHLRKNPAWVSLGGGFDTATDEICNDIVTAMLEDKNAPCHAEQAFGDYVWKRCVDAGRRLFAKKHSAGEPLEDVEGETVRAADLLEPNAHQKSPERLVIEGEEAFADARRIEKIRQIAQTDLPPKLQLAFDLRFFRQLKIESKKDRETITRIMGVSEKTATKYINEAIQIVKQRLSDD